MTIIRPLHASIRIVALRVGLDVVDGETHDLAVGLADFILGHLVFA